MRSDGEPGCGCGCGILLVSWLVLWWMVSTIWEALQ